jgi:hypothetical protein
VAPCGQGLKARIHVKVKGSDLLHGAGLSALINDTGTPPGPAGRAGMEAGLRPVQASSPPIASHLTSMYFTNKSILGRDLARRTLERGSTLTPVPF